MSHTEELKDLKHMKKNVTKVLTASDKLDFFSEDAEKNGDASGAKKPKRKNLWLLVSLCALFVLIIVFLVYTVVTYFGKKETGGAQYPGKIAYAYIEVFNKEGTNQISDYVSKECPHRQSFIDRIEDGMDLNRVYIKNLDEGAAIVTVGTSYDEKARKDILTKKGYKKTKASDVKDVTLVTGYTDFNGNPSDSTLTYTFVVMNVDGKWFLLEMKQQDIVTETEEIATITDAATVTDASATDANGLINSIYSKEFIFDGKKYTMPFEYSNISNKYSFELSDYGYDEGYKLSGGDMITGTIALSNEDMDENVSIWVGFINDTDASQELEDTSINSIRMDMRWATTEKYPELILPGNITWGSTAEDIINAYGEPNDAPVYSEEYGYTVYKYTNETRDYHVELVVYDELGLTEISLRAY